MKTLYPLEVQHHYALFNGHNDKGNLYAGIFWFRGQNIAHITKIQDFQFDQSREHVNSNARL